MIVDGGKGLEAALASLWDDVPVQRCAVHKERNLLAHAPKLLHDAIKADFNDMVPAKTAAEVLARRKAVLAKWRLRCPPVAKSRDEAGARLFTFLRYPPEQWRSLRTHERHRTSARGVQAPGQDPVPAALRRDRRHAVLGALGLGSDHPAPGRRLADP